MKIDVNKWHYKAYRAYKVMRNDISREYYFDGEYDYTIDQLFDRREFMTDNFCQYWRGVLLWPVLNIVFSTIMAGITLFSIGVILTSSPGGVAMVGLMIAGIIGFIALLMFIAERFKGAIQDNILTEDNIVYQAYKNNKEKICPIIEYTKEGE